MLRFHRTPVLRGTELEPVDGLWVNIPDDELCHVMLLLPGKSVIDDINDIIVWTALQEQEVVSQFFCETSVRLIDWEVKRLCRKFWRIDDVR